MTGNGGQGTRMTRPRESGAAPLRMERLRDDPRIGAE